MNQASPYDRIKGGGEGANVEYKLIRSNRRSIQLRIQEEGDLLVRAPYGISKQQLDAILKEKEEWILKKQEKIRIERSIRTKNRERPFQTGRELLYCGEKYILKIETCSENAKVKIKKDENKKIIIYSIDSKQEETSKEIEEQLKKWYRQEARCILTDKCKYYSNKMGVTYEQIRVKETKTRWGSCSSLGNLNFNWKILLAPIPVQDYLVVHELAHRKEMNHSRSFYDIVETYFPNYKEVRQWLKENGKFLEL